MSYSIIQKYLTFEKNHPIHNLLLLKVKTLTLDYCTLNLCSQFTMLEKLAVGTLSKYSPILHITFLNNNKGLFIYHLHHKPWPKKFLYSARKLKVKRKLLAIFSYFDSLRSYLIDCHLFLLICLADVAILGSEVHSFILQLSLALTTLDYFSYHVQKKLYFIQCTI